MAASNECPECEKARPADAPQGLCPRCLLNRGLEDDDPDAVELVGSLPWISRSTGSSHPAEIREQSSPPSHRDTEPDCGCAFFALRRVGLFRVSRSRESL